MYTNEGLSIICRRLSNAQSLKPFKDEMARLMCIYAGKQEIHQESHVKEMLIKSSKLFHDESLKTGQSLLSLFGEWLGNKAFRYKCLNDPSLILEGSAVLEVYPHICVEVPALQIIYDNVDWFPSDLPKDVIDYSTHVASKNVARILDSIYKNS